MHVKTLAIATLATIASACTVPQHATQTPDDRYELEEAVDSLYEEVYTESYGKPYMLRYLRREEKDGFSYASDNDVNREFVERYHGLDAYSRVMYMTEDLLRINQKNKELRERNLELLQQPVIEYVEKPANVTDRDVQRYLSRNDYEAIKKRELSQMRKRLASPIVQHPEITLQKVKNYARKQRAAYLNSQDTIAQLLAEIDSLKQLPPIQRERIRPETYENEQEVPQGALMMRLSGNTFTFPQTQYLCRYEEKRFVCIDLADIYEQNQ